jgi:hypothetical protein
MRDNIQQLHGDMAVLAAPPPSQVTNNFPELKGRFLHITDIHPDPHYVRGGTFESACHRRAKKLDRRRGASRLDDNGEEEGEDSILRGGGGGSGSGPNGGAGRWGDPLT